MVVILNYREIVDYIEEIPKFTSKNPLDHTKALLKCLGDPQNQMQVIHVAGTNGKGSVCAYLDSMLRAGGYKVGLFTSPHLVKINERFKINGEMISDERFVKAFEEVQKIIKKAQEDGLDHPSYFETLFLMGMVVFKEANVDYVVLETGLGGRLDATNTVDHPLACIITSISLDHVEYLGDTIGKIAGEKAGIIKPQVPVIYDGHQPEASEVIEKRANEIDDAFTRTTLSMVADGFSADFIYEVAENDIKQMEERHRANALIFSQGGMYAPTLGVLGAVIGLIAALGNLSDIDKLGHSIAAAFVATLLGIFTGYVCWHPFANKLKRLSAAEVEIKKMILEGALALQSGASSLAMEAKLQAFIPVSERKQRND